MDNKMIRFGGGRKWVCGALAAVMTLSLWPVTALGVKGGSILGDVQAELEEKRANAAPVEESLVKDASMQVDITLRTAQDLIDLSARCQNLDYSAGLVVSLEQDIDLEGIDFMPIPSFSGTFLGNGHTVSHFNCGTNGSHQGFFRYVRNTGTVINLTVSGCVAPTGTRCAVGGIVGTNYGFVGNCTFSGTVSGLLNTGGIVGENYGIVKDCVSTAAVQAKHFSGGIVGSNSGSVGYCRNEGPVNTEIFRNALSLDMLQLDDILGLSQLADTQVDTVSDVGGIVGISEGIVKACENTGDVGYQHYGYNIGGVAGRQSGYMSQCLNSGEVRGRKDVGGIVGQMVPFLILQKSVNAGDELSAMQRASDTALTNLDSNSAVLGESLSASAAYGVAISDNYYDTAGVIQRAKDGEVPTKEELKDGKKVEGGKTKGEAKAEAEAEAEQAPEKLSEWMVEKGEKVQEYTDTLGEDTINTITDGGKLTDTDKEHIADTAKKGADDLSETMARRKAERTAEQTQEEAEAAKRNEDIANAVKSAQQLGGSFSSTVSQLTEDLSNVSQHYNNVLSMIANALTGNYEITILDDISDQDTEGQKDGKVELCRNTGAVSGDTDVGGIAGTMDTELDFDVDDILSMDENGNTTVSLSSSTYYCRNILTECTNDGVITGKKEHIGGIIGDHVVGNVLLSQNYGDILGTGDYFGGVAGKSSANIRKCFAMCDLEGTSYIGGITGQGRVIENCSTIVTADTAAACSGSIAGWVDFDSADSCIIGNYFVNDTMGGIDGITYDGVCERVSYDELLTLKALPKEFRQLRLTFMADGEEVETIEFTYGDSLREDQIPAVPEKDGIPGIWSAFSYENMTRSQVVEAVYNSRQTVVASRELWGDGPLSRVLLQGAFSRSTRIGLSDYAGDVPLPERALEATVMTLSDTGFSDGKYEVRWNTGGSRVKVYLLREGAWEETAAHQDGRYAVFACQGDEITVCLTDTPLGALKKAVRSLWPLGK